jgi:hypothetical protein
MASDGRPSVSPCQCKTRAASSASGSRLEIAPASVSSIGPQPIPGLEDPGTQCARHQLPAETDAERRQAARQAALQDVDFCDQKRVSVASWTPIGRRARSAGLRPQLPAPQDRQSAHRGRKSRSRHAREQARAARDPRRRHVVSRLPSVYERACHPRNETVTVGSREAPRPQHPSQPSGLGTAAPFAATSSWGTAANLRVSRSEGDYRIYLGPGSERDRGDRR